MVVPNGFVDMLNDVLAPLGRVSIRRMFGGHGIYCDGAMFGLLADEVVYLKTDVASQPAFEAEGCEPFTFDGRGRRVVTSYRRMPDRLLDDPDEMVAWARTALGAARRSAASRSRKSSPATGGKPKSPRRRSP